MNFFLILICFLVFITFEGNAQAGRWVKVDSVKVKYRPSDDGYMGNRFMAIDCYDSLNCIAAANVGLTIPLFRATSDGGKTWETVFYDSIIEDPKDSSIIYYPPRVADISYPSRNLCVAVADTDYYYYSNDGLKTWKKGQLDAYRKSELGLNQKVDFFNEKIGLIKIGTYLFLTTDGCNSWTKLDFDLPDSLIPSDVNAVKMITERSIILLASRRINGISRRYILLSKNLGKSWMHYSPSPKNISDIYFFDEMNGFGAGSPQINDKTNTFNDYILQIINGDTMIARLDTLSKPTWGLQKIIFYDRLNGAALGMWYKMWLTTDGGINWFRDTSYNNKNMNDYFKDISFLDSKTLLGVSNQDRYIYKYTEEPLSVPINKPIINDVILAPNPSNGVFTLYFNLIEPSKINIKIFNLIGNLVYCSTSEYLQIGEQKKEINLNSLEYGIYLCQLFLNNTTKQIKLILIK